MLDILTDIAALEKRTIVLQMWGLVFFALRVWDVRRENEEVTV